MKRQIQTRSSATYKNSHVIEHTPIYDLDAYQQRQKKLKFAKLRKNIFETFSFCFCIVLTFSMLYLGE